MLKPKQIEKATEAIWAQIAEKNFSSEFGLN